MTQTVETRPATASPTAMDRVDNVLEGLWHFLSSMRVAMVVMLAIAVMGVIGSLLIQAPAAVWADPASRADWLDGRLVKYEMY